MELYAQQDALSPELESLHRDVDAQGFVPGWYRPGNSPMWAEPAGPFAPATWRYEQAHELLRRAGEQVSPEFAERRNLVMVNPSEGNRYPTVRTQVMAYQMMRSGERARTHRHSAHAGRVVLDADDGAYTVVEGEKLPMRPGDVLLTPGWAWHGHGHDGHEPAYWIDFLDVPLVHLLDPMFFEPYPGTWQEPSSETRRSPLLFPYDEVSAALDDTPVDHHDYFGRHVQLGDPALPTIGLRMHRLDAGAVTGPLRTTANYQYCVVAGTGSSWINGVERTWSRGDVVVVPCWSEQRHATTDGATLLAVTDEPLQSYCGYFRTAEDVRRGDGRHRPARPQAVLGGSAR